MSDARVDTAAVRAEVRAALGAAGVDDAGDLELAVHETLVNAHEHGRHPVQVDVRPTAGQVEVVVRDAGPGPASLDPPTAPADPEAACGRGRWLAHQLAVVDERRTAAGFEVRLVAGRGRAGARG